VQQRYTNEWCKTQARHALAGGCFGPSFLLSWLWVATLTFCSTSSTTIGGDFQVNTLVLRPYAAYIAEGSMPTGTHVLWCSIVVADVQERKQLQK